MFTYTFTASNGQVFTHTTKRTVSFGLIVTDHNDGTTSLSTTGALSSCKAQASAHSAANKRSGKPGFGNHNYTWEIVPAVVA